MNQEIVKIQKESNQVIEQAKSFSIIHQISYENAAKYLIRIKGLIKEIKITFDPIVKKAHEAHKEATLQRNIHLDPVVQAESILKTKCKDYEREMEKKAEEARRKVEEERQKKIDEENKRRQDEADAKAKKEAELFNEDPKDVVADKVEEVTPDDIEVEQPLPTIEKVTGLGFKRTWKAKVIDKSKIPLEYLEVNMPALNRVAREMKEKFNVPGASACKD